jgi:hypothetical protein
VRGRRAGLFSADRPGEMGPDVTPKEVRPPLGGVAGPYGCSAGGSADGTTGESAGGTTGGTAGESAGGTTGDAAELSGRPAPSWAAATRGPNHVDVVVPGVGLASGTGNCTGGRR